MPSMQPGSAESRPFHVDLRGVVDLLSRHIYSGPRVYLRELMQNGRDAIAARAEFEGTADPHWGIRIIPAGVAGSSLRFLDDGVGLTADEVGDLLATVGRSSKRDILDLPRSDYLGQFGIGLLSCFMVADSIVIRSRSARGGAPVEWIGNAEGTFTVRELTKEEGADLPIGTEVTLTPRADDSELITLASVTTLAQQYGEFLSVPIRIVQPDGSYPAINRTAPFRAVAHNADERTRLFEYGRELVGSMPFDTIDLSVPGTDTVGTAFVLPYSPVPGAKQLSSVYLGGMLLNARVDDLMPDWAFFVRTVIDTTVLHPTASREQLVEDETLEYTREQLGAAVRRWVLRLGTSNPTKLAEFVAIHHLALRALIVHDDELAGFITRWLSVETSLGYLTFDELTRTHPHVRYAETVDEFRQIAGIVSRDRPVVNGGYVYDSEILRRLPAIFDGVTVEKITVSSEIDNLDPPSLADRGLAVALEERASAVLAESECRALVRGFAPHDVASLYLADAEVLRSAQRGTARGIAPSLWGGVLGRVDENVAAARDADDVLSAKLCLNWNNPLVRTLARTSDDAVFARSIQLLYVQALLAGHRPLSAHDRGILSTAMTDLVQLSIAKN